MTMLAYPVAKGDSIDYTPAAAVAAGAIVLLGWLVGVATSAIAASVQGALAVSGIFEFAKDDTSGPVIAVGDPVFWDATNSVATNVQTRNLPYLGTCVAAAGASDAVVRVRLNDGASIPAALQGRLWEEVTDNKTLDIEDVGKVMLVTVDAKVITLPSVAAGLRYVVANGGADGAVAVNVSPAAADKIMGADLAGVDNKDRINTKATAKRLDYLDFEYGSADGWLVNAERGIWAAEA